jgi:hypothetical protein
VTFVQLGVKEWIFADVKDICLPTQSSFLTCPHNQVFFTASAVWYVVQSSFCKQLLTRCGQGFDRSKSPIWCWVDLSPSVVCYHHWDVPAFAVLALETVVPAIMGTLGEHTRHHLWPICHPAHDGDQLLVMVPRRIHVPIPHQEAQFYVVEQIQLCNECGNG